MFASPACVRSTMNIATKVSDLVRDDQLLGYPGLDEALRTMLVEHASLVTL